MFLSSQEFIELSRALEVHHSIFYFLWKVTRFIFTDNYNGQSLEKAAITITRSREIILFINPEYWQKISFVEKLFLICHELMHLILDHPGRSKYIESKDSLLANYCMDAIDNQLLVTAFGFKREELSFDGIWPNNLIPGICLPWGKSFEYYFEQAKIHGFKPEGDLIDQHFFDFPAHLLPGILQILPEQDKKLISQLTQDGCIKAKNKNIAWPAKFLRILQAKTDHERFQEEREQWLKPSRRFAATKQKVFLPSIQPVDHGKTTITAFIDVSYSCHDRVQDFFDLVISLPSQFEKKIYAFSDQISNLTQTSQGLTYQYGKTTSFTCMEKFILEQRQYPDLICVFTDGIGADFIKPKHPERWHWFLSENNTHYLPEKSPRYLLEKNR